MLPAKDDERHAVEVTVSVDGTLVTRRAMLELPDVLLEVEFGALFSRRAANI